MLVDKKNKNGSFIASTLITIIIVALLIASGPLVNALKVTLSADKVNVTAGAAGDAGNITFTTWVNLSSPDAYVPIQRIYLNLSGPLPRSFSFNTNGEDIQGIGFAGELSVSTSNGFNLSNYGSGPGSAYDSKTGGSYDFGYGYGYGSPGGAGISPLNVSYTIILNTTYMYDGNYTATTNVYAAKSSASHGFASTSSVSFEVLPRIFTAVIPGIPANGSASSPLISTPVGDYSFMIMAGENDTIPVTLNVTVQVNSPTGVSTQVNSTATGGLGAGAIPGLYFNYSVNDSSWYDNISYIHMRMYYNDSDLPSNVAESTLRPARYLSNTTPEGWVKLECGTCPRTLEVAEDGRNVILKAGGVDSNNNYVWANVTHFSTFAIAGTVSSSNGGGGGGGGSGGGGGGGGGGSPENYSNILLIEKHDLRIFKDQLASYKFSDSRNRVIFVNITGNVNSGGEVTTIVEILKGKSILATIPAPEIVYQYLNIWVGTSGFATPKNIKEGVITFKVNNSWFTQNKRSSSDIRMFRWDGSQWVILETREIFKDIDFTFFEARTNAFSPFAISGINGDEPVPTPEVIASVTETKPVPTPESKETTVIETKPPISLPEIPEWVFQVLIAAIIISFEIYFFVLRNRNKK